MIPSTSVLISSAPLQTWLPLVVYAHLEGVSEAIWTELYWQWERKGHENRLPWGECPCDFLLIFLCGKDCV